MTAAGPVWSAPFSDDIWRTCVVCPFCWWQLQDLCGLPLFLMASEGPVWSAPLADDSCKICWVLHMLITSADSVLTAIMSTTAGGCVWSTLMLIINSHRMYVAWVWTDISCSICMICSKLMATAETVWSSLLLMTAEGPVWSAPFADDSWRTSAWSAPFADDSCKICVVCFVLMTSADSAVVCYNVYHSWRMCVVCPDADDSHRIYVAGVWTACSCVICMICSKLMATEDSVRRAVCHFSCWQPEGLWPPLPFLYV